MFIGSLYLNGYSAGLFYLFDFAKDGSVLDNYTSLFLNRKGQISGYYEIFISTVNDILSSELF